MFCHSEFFPQVYLTVFSIIDTTLRTVCVGGKGANTVYSGTGLGELHMFVFNPHSYSVLKITLSLLYR